MIYIDSNVFIMAALYRHEVAENARAIIDVIEDGELRASTSALTYDEVYWVVKTQKGDRKAAHRACQGLLELPNLLIIDVDSSILWKAHELLEGYKLDPRDAIHAACAITKNIKTFVSEDRDFDRIKGIKRTSIARFSAGKRK